MVRAIANYSRTRDFRTIRAESHVRTALAVARLQIIKKLVAKRYARIRNHKCRSLTEAQVDVTIERPLTARRCDLCGMLDVAAAYEPAQIAFRYAVAAEFS